MVDARFRLLDRTVLDVGGGVERHCCAGVEATDIEDTDGEIEGCRRIRRALAIHAGPLTTSTSIKLPALGLSDTRIAGSSPHTLPAGVRGLPIGIGALAAMNALSSSSESSSLSSPVSA